MFFPELKIQNTSLYLGKGGGGMLDILELLKLLSKKTPQAYLKTNK